MCIGDFSRWQRAVSFEFGLAIRTGLSWIRAVQYVGEAKSVIRIGSRAIYAGVENRVTRFVLLRIRSKHLERSVKVIRGLPNTGEAVNDLALIREFVVIPRPSRRKVKARIKVADV